MEKIKCVTLIIAVVSIIAITKAEEPSVIRKGLLKTQITISPAVFFKNKQSLFYLHGNVEGFVTRKISVTGDAYMSLGNTGVAAQTFKFNHNIFFGASYHITQKNNDFYLGLQPGISITKVILLSENTKPAKTGVNPVIAIVIGYNYYVYKYFHFFVESRFVTGQHLYNTRKDLSEFRFSAGLGFNINAKRK